jgi:hypothetical protein
MQPAGVNGTWPSGFSVEARANQRYRHRKMVLTVVTVILAPPHDRYFAAVDINVRVTPVIKSVVER